MPPRGTSEGFSTRNAIVGNTWTSYTEDQQTVFNPKYFERLARLSLKDTASNSLVISPPEDQSSVPPEDPLNDEEVTKYLPIFKELVNHTALARDFKEGHLCRNSGKQWNREQIMKCEIKRIAQRVGSHFILQYFSLRFSNHCVLFPFLSFEFYIRNSSYNFTCCSEAGILKTQVQGRCLRTSTLHVTNGL